MVRDGTPALVFGRNDALLEVKTVITDRNPFRPGDLLITSGAGGIYPPDVAVAVVVKPTAEGALARPAVAPEKLGFVIVEEPFVPRVTPPAKPPCRSRSEEHTSELQSLMRISYAVFCLKNKKRQ